MSRLVLCGECGARAVLSPGYVVFPHRPDLGGKMLWTCQCGARVGCHKGTTIPLGFPAAPKTRAARIRAHAAFDPLWRRKMAQESISQNRARAAAYAWLSRELGVDPKDTHIGHMSAEMADRVTGICQRRGR